MADPFVAEVRIFPFNFAPQGWAFCDGSLLPISQNGLLYSLLGVTYGGNGNVTFALPNLQGRAAVQTGQGQGLSEYFLGQEEGVEAVTLLSSEIPIHTHAARVTTDSATDNDPGPSRVLGVASTNAYNATPTMQMAPLGAAGGGLPHNNMQPYLTLNFCIALSGEVPQRP